MYVNATFLCLLYNLRLLYDWLRTANMSTTMQNRRNCCPPASVSAQALAAAGRDSRPPSPAAPSPRCHGTPWPAQPRPPVHANQRRFPHCLVLTQTLRQHRRQNAS